VVLSRLRKEYADQILTVFEGPRGDYEEKQARCTGTRTARPACLDVVPRMCWPAVTPSQKRQIVVDLPRTNPNIELFQDERVQLSLHRLLYIWAIRHPGTGYVQVRNRFVVWIALSLHFVLPTHAAQGMNDLATPFFVVFLCSEIGIVYAPKTVEGVDEEVLQRVEADTCVAACF
jgi:hypothetical protein